MRRKPRQLKSEELENQIIKLLSKSPRTRFTAAQISKKINVANPPDHIQKLLEKLYTKGIIIRMNDNLYKWDTRGNVKNQLEKAPKHILVGTVDMTRSGAAYITGTDLADDIYIPSKYIKGAMHKDVVKVEVPKISTRRRPEGIIVEIIRRSVTHVIGNIRFFEKFAIVFPENNKIYPEVHINLSDALDASEGGIVVAEISDWGTGQNKSIWGKVVRNIGEADNNEMAMQAILLSNGFDIEFPSDVLKETEKLSGLITPEEIAKRRDFRNITTVTIDPATAKDFDDALSFRKLDNGNIEIGVHIADVTHFLKEKTAMDDEAFERSTSVYLVDRVCPMLPEKISNDLCSLNPHEDKYTFSAVFEFDQKNNIVSEWFGKSIIYSDRRFTYEEAQERIETRQGDFAEEINAMNDIALILRKERFNNGSISFESEEVQFILDEKNKPIGISVKERKDAHLLVEDFMLLANKKVATFISKKTMYEIPFIYRVHDLPNPEKLMDFALFAKELGFHFKADTPAQIADSFNRLSQAAKENEALHLLEPLAVRTMAKAVYTTENIGHYGLGFEYYTHFTSPIRRYSDVLVHRILEQNLSTETRVDKELLEQKAKYISQQERKAMEAERESIKYKQTEYISAHIGEDFDGIISGIIDKGFFVELKESKVEGLVAFSSLADSYQVDSSRFRAKSRISGDDFHMGQTVRVKILSTDLSARKTDMELITEE